MPVNNAFYLVWDGIMITPPQKKHENVDSAREEAKRLAEQNQGIEFFILRVVEGIKYIDSPWRHRNFKKGECE